MDDTGETVPSVTTVQEEHAEQPEENNGVQIEMPVDSEKPAAIRLSLGARVAMALSAALVLFIAAFICLTCTVKYDPNDPAENPLLNPQMGAVRQLLGSPVKVEGALQKAARLEFVFSEKPVRRGRGIYLAHYRDAGGNAGMSKAPVLVNEVSSEQDYAVDEWKLLEGMKQSAVVPQPVAFYSYPPHDSVIMKVPNGQTIEETVRTGPQPVHLPQLAKAICSALRDFKSHGHHHLDISLSSFWLTTDPDPELGERRAILIDFSRCKYKSAGMFVSTPVPPLSNFYDPAVALKHPALADRIALGFALTELYLHAPGLSESPIANAFSDSPSQFRAMKRYDAFSDLLATYSVDKMAFQRRRHLADLYINELVRAVSNRQMDKTTAIVIAAAIGDTDPMGITIDDLWNFFTFGKRSERLNAHVSNIEWAISRCGGWGRAVVLSESFAYAASEDYVGSMLESSGDGRPSAALLYSTTSDFYCPDGAKLTWGRSFVAYRVSIGHLLKPVGSVERMKKEDEEAMSDSFLELQTRWFRAGFILDSETAAEYLYVDPSNPRKIVVSRFPGLLFLGAFGKEKRPSRMRPLDLSVPYSSSTNFGPSPALSLSLLDASLKVPFHTGARQLPAPNDIVRVFDVLSDRILPLAAQGLAYYSNMDLTDSIVIRPDGRLFITESRPMLSNVGAVHGQWDRTVVESWAALCDYFGRTAINVVVAPNEMRLPSKSGLDTVVPTCVVVKSTK